MMAGTVKLSLHWLRLILKVAAAAMADAGLADTRGLYSPDLMQSQIEAIDMARRGIHNEGSRVLQERLEGKVTIDDDTARRLFTLICVLHFGG